MKKKVIIKKFNEWNISSVRSSNGKQVEPLTCKKDSSHDYLIAFKEKGVIKLGCNNCDYTENFVPSWALDNIK